MYLCHQCQALFESPERHNPTDRKEAKCPQCGSTDFEELNFCSINIGIDSGGPPPWEYICYHCKSYFVVPVSHSPDEAKKIKCPTCQSTNLARLNVDSLETMHHTCFG